MTLATLALTSLLSLHPIRSAAAPGLAIQLRSLARRLTPAFVSARGHDGRKGSGVLLKVTLWRF
jgi:hypothetical protein